MVTRKRKKTYVELKENARLMNEKVKKENTNRWYPDECQDHAMEHAQKFIECDLFPSVLEENRLHKMRKRK